MIIKRILLMVGLVAVAGCTTMSDREAPSKCFNTDGNINASCEFKLLKGQPAVFAYLDARVMGSDLARG